MQSSVAILALAAVAVLVVMHHRSEGRMLTQTQEEMILIGAFGLTWFAILVGVRAYQRVGVDPSLAMHGKGASSQPNAVSSAVGDDAWKRQYPCDSNSVYCVDEEWSWY
ncbi:hypothetical protein K474DRAFT_1656216 [Panus rudis PR-1116 ss-1]|nr:hypothetical protein K474DRAFT_1656216 [Panus rudis PR-1116 ss-1]